MGMSRGALAGEHYCENHQGNHSHYAPHNCTVCKLEQQLAELRKLAQAVVDAREADLIRADGCLPTTAQSKSIDALAKALEWA